MAQRPKADPQEELVSIERMTPALAQEFLDANQGNRIPNLAAVENFTRQMKAGLWRFNGDAYRISKTGRLLDGQHRCMAVVRSGVTLEQVVVVRGLEDESQATMDQGRKRTASDVLAMSNISNGNQIAAVARLVHDWKSGRRSIGELNKGTRNNLTNDEIRMWAERDPHLQKAAAVSIRSGMRALATAKVTGALWYLTHEADPGKNEEFFDLLESGAGLEKKNPILVVRNYWQNLRVAGSAPAVRYFDGGVRAWNRWMIGAEMSMISQRLERDIPDLFVPTGGPNTVNRYSEVIEASNVLQLVSEPAAVAPKPKPKRALPAPGGDGALFRER